MAGTGSFWNELLKVFDDVNDVPMAVKGTDGALHMVPMGSQDGPGTWSHKSYSDAAGDAGAEPTNTIASITGISAIAAVLTYKDRGSAAGVAITVVINPTDATDAQGKLNAKEGYRLFLGDTMEVYATVGNEITAIYWQSDAAETGASELALSYKVSL